MKNIPHPWEPPYRAYSVDIGAPEVTVAVLGVQASRRGTARRGLSTVTALLVGADGLSSHEVCDVLMEADVHHAVAVTYWSTRTEFDAWWESTRVQGLVATFMDGDAGLFCEVFSSPRDHLEANSSTPDADWGLGRTHPWLEDPRIGYKGASRDRIEAAEDGALPATVDSLSAPHPTGAPGRRVTITAPGNVCFIRTVQGWSGASDEQRNFFLRGPYRAYLAGVRDLQEHPEELACLSARLLSQPLAHPRRPVRETQAWFLSLAHMEQWVWHSATHGQIIKTFGRFAERFGVDISLLLSHEVYVVPAGQATATYVNCAHPTGFLRWPSTVEATSGPAAVGTPSGVS